MSAGRTKVGEKKINSLVSIVGLASASFKIGIIAFALFLLYGVVIFYQCYQAYRFFADNYVIDKAEISNYVSVGSTANLIRSVIVTVHAKNRSAPNLSWGASGGAPIGGDMNAGAYAILTDARGKEWFNGHDRAKGTRQIRPGYWEISYSDARRSDIPLTSRPLKLTVRLWFDNRSVLVSVPAQPKIGRWNSWFLTLQKTGRILTAKNKEYSYGRHAFIT